MYLKKKVPLVGGRLICFGSKEKGSPVKAKHPFSVPRFFTIKSQRNISRVLAMDMKLNLPFQMTYFHRILIRTLQGARDELHF